MSLQTMIKFYRDAPPPVGRGEAAKIAAFGVGEIAATRLPNGEVITPKELPGNADLTHEMARLEVRPTGKRNLPYAVWFVIDWEGEKSERKMYRTISFHAAKDWIQINALRFMAAQVAEAGGDSLMTGYTIVGGKAQKKYDLLPDDARRVSGGTEEV